VRLLGTFDETASRSDPVTGFDEVVAVGQSPDQLDREPAPAQMTVTTIAQNTCLVTGGTLVPRAVDLGFIHATTLPEARTPSQGPRSS